MHCIPSIEGIKYGNTTAICDCCGCSCLGLRPAEEFKTNEAVASNYAVKLIQIIAWLVVAVMKIVMRTKSSSQLSFH